MTFLLIIIAWLFVLSLVAGMCAVASAGDIEPLAQAPSPRDQGVAGAPVWEPAEDLEIYAHASGARALPAERAGSLTHSSGVAA
jgi:hypothetical protein